PGYCTLFEWYLDCAPEILGNPPLRTRTADHQGKGKEKFFGVAMFRIFSPGMTVVYISRKI
ncbi:MAG: hypothetical protein WCG27_03240, partial [Pseudomonadota bacterium]